MRVGASAYCGIDVAFGKRKTLPIAVCPLESGDLRPLPLRNQMLRQPPRGAGNAAALDRPRVEAFTAEALEYLRWVEHRFDVKIERIAIDAPRDYAPEGGRRAAELAMDAKGISCFATPSRSAFERHRQRTLAHLDSGGPGGPRVVVGAEAND